MINNALIDIYKGYQGQKPELAKIFFLGNDANFSEKFVSHEGKEFLKNHIEPYLKDGVSYWKTKRAHHPFVHSDYPFDKRIDGVPYHSNFRKIYSDNSSLTEKLPDLVSFIEIIPYPTIGNVSDKERKEAFISNEKGEIQHVDKLFTSLMNRTDNILIFIPKKVLDALKYLKNDLKLKSLIEIPAKLFDCESFEEFCLGKNRNIRIIKSTHFSATIKDEIKIGKPREIISDFLKKNL